MTDNEIIGYCTIGGYALLALACWGIGYAKGRSWFGFVGGVLFGPIAFLILLILPDRRVNQSGKNPTV